MSGHQVPDEAARLEAALERIASAAARRQAAAHARAALPEHAPHATTPPEAAETAEIAERLDALIADLRTVLGTQGP